MNNNKARFKKVGALYVGSLLAIIACQTSPCSIALADDRDVQAVTVHDRPAALLGGQDLTRDATEATAAPSTAPSTSLPIKLDAGLKHAPRLALALGGGGTRGAAHIGVLRVLERNGIKPDIIIGTSMGAIVGGMYSAGLPLDVIAEKFDDGKLMHSYMTVPLYFRFAVAPIMLAPRACGFHPYDGLYRGNKFRKYLDRALPQSIQNIEDLKITFAALALNLVDGKTYPLTKGNLGYAMQASSAIPGLRKPVRIGNKLFVDGGVVDNVPVNECRQMGADIVIAVDVDERFDEVPMDSFRKMGSVSQRIVELQLATIDAVQLLKADVVIHPNVDGIGLISTSVKQARRAIAAGEKAAEAAIPEIRAKMHQAGLALRTIEVPIK